MKRPTEKKTHNQHLFHRYAGKSPDAIDVEDPDLLTSRSRGKPRVEARCFATQSANDECSSAPDGPRRIFEDPSRNQPCGLSRVTSEWPARWTTATFQPALSHHSW
jgi:hypothetical protein